MSGSTLPPRGRPQPPRRTGPATRSRRLRRFPAALAVVAASFAAGAVVGTGHGGPSRQSIALRFAASWAHEEYAAMYADIDAHSRHTLSQKAFQALYEHATAIATATATGQRVIGPARQLADGSISVPVVVKTRLFGTLRSSFHLRFSTANPQLQIAWSRSLEFPGMRRGELLHRHTSMPARASLLTRTRSPLATGPAAGAGQRSSPLGAAAGAVVGSVGPIPADERHRLLDEGVPPEAIVGTTGLERIFDAQLRGTPGGKLLAGKRVIAHVSPEPGDPVRTTISGPLQTATVEALGDQYGGIVALQPRTGQILAVAGIGLDALQPPGSTFKMITVTGVLQNKIATPHTIFPYRTSATLDGVELHNSEQESCGGTLALAFAVSCNSVFAPLGVKLGADRLVATAERYGFNHPPGIVGAAESTLPAGSSIEGELALGSTAIGQGEVLASPLQMATVAATIANGGLHMTPTYSPSAHPRATRASSPEIAHEVRGMMIRVVSEGTGTAAAIPGVAVAGKTGTAELGTPSSESCPSSGQAPEVEGEAESEQPEQSGCTSEDNPEDTDAWFAAFAPAQKPKVAVAVLLVRDGFGGDTAAPVAREVLEAGLRQ